MVYIWGHVGEHNVVIASLPAGVYGTTCAATTASSLIHSLPHIRISVLVGIEGGIARPDLNQDIRLGDIVAKAKGLWERKDLLNKPPPVLLHALASLQAEHELAPSKVPKLLQAMLEINLHMGRPKMDYSQQGAGNDRLFQSQYDHISGFTGGQPDPSWEVDREQRDSTGPEIHYGIIASGNTLIKDAATRDSLWESTGHQCLVNSKVKNIL
ncbi:hypothetical protein N7520_002481 [Penicillium odoratum]|uniref:uncharacterized protein n=1 Tax=Penicillium odoratum TaxID=1167516 RepID=UPI0025478160|nr:uncharacterized protein N7520_002481 [Penicillium odoratum]KAJ5771952.1 hypothetical protein N7520_002481 [Penicillium odoratum]